MKKAKALLFLSILSLLVVSYSALPLVASVQDADVISTGARCCSYGSQCATDKCCLAAGPNELPCSQNRPGYCRDCPVAIEAGAANLN